MLPVGQFFLSDPGATVMQKTRLYDQHQSAGARMIDFGGWMLPVNYGSQVEEHHACRNHAVMFDVSHMTIVDIAGDKDESPQSVATGSAGQFLRKLLANDVSRLKAPGDALYSCMLDAAGGVLDDLIVYWRGDDDYRVILNAATREKDLAWINEKLNQIDSASHKVPVLNVRDDLALIAVQGPEAVAIFEGVMQRQLDAASIAAAGVPLGELPRFSSLQCGDWFIGRTGYTGEDGVEVALPADQVTALWKALLAADVRAAGLGARDTLRLEAAMNLYGSDMDESCNPYECGIGWSVALSPSERDFYGREALENALGEAGSTDRQMVGLVLDGRGVLRGGQPVLFADQPVGVVTSGTYSPTLEKSIAMARVSLAACKLGSAGELTDKTCQVEIRGKAIDAHFVKRPFVKN